MQELIGEEVFLTLEIPVVLGLTGLLLLRYAPGHGGLSWFVVGLAWFLSLLTPALLSLDIAEALAERCSFTHPESVSNCPRPTAEPGMIRTAWYLIYWLSFFLSWFLLPIVASYSISGAFGPLKKLHCAVRDRLLLWGGSLSFTLICSMVLMLRFDFTWFALTGILETLVNSFGLLVVIVMMGHGLVEVPKQLWQQGDHEQQLRSIECRLTELTERIDDARASLARVMGQVEAARKRFDELSTELSHEELKPLSSYLCIIESELPASTGDTPIPKPIVADIPDNVTEATLEDLRKDLKTRVIEFCKVNYLWQSKCHQAFFLQDVISWKKAELTTNDNMTEMNFAFRCLLLPLLSRLVALAACGMSIAVVFAEVTVWSIQPWFGRSVSPFEYLIHLQNRTGLFVQVVSFCILSYMALCTFYSLFRFKLFRIYELVPQHTDIYTLFLNSMLCCRVAPVLAYNFLTVVHETSFSVAILNPPGSPCPAFSFIARSMEEVPFLGVGFNLYFPSLLLVFVVLNLTNFWGWFLARMGAHFLKLCFDGDENDEDRKRGRRILASERRKWARRTEHAEDLGASVGEEHASMFDPEDGNLMEE